MTTDLIRIPRHAAQDAAAEIEHLARLQWEQIQRDPHDLSAKALHHRLDRLADDLRRGIAGEYLPD